MTEKQIRCPSCSRYYPPDQVRKKVTNAGINAWRWRCLGCEKRAKTKKDNVETKEVITTRKKKNA